MSADLARCRTEQSRCVAFMAANGDDGPEGERLGVLIGWLDWGAEARMVNSEDSKKWQSAAIVMSETLVLSEGRYRTRNGRIVELTGQYPNAWYGRFVEKLEARDADKALRIWDSYGMCQSANHRSWDLVERVDVK